ncbi:MAG: SGNH/GDSL hydrolase family protein [Fimbriimonas sp.]
METLKKLLILCLLAVASIGIAQEQWQQDIVRFEAQDLKSPPSKGGIVFVGSSSIARWKTLKDDFPKHNVLNRGFGGSQLSDSVFYAERIVTPYEPRMVFLFAGTNDIAANKTADQVFGDYQAFVAKVRAKLPNTRIAYISITPAPSRQAKWNEFKKANALIRDYTLKDSNLIFIDTWPYFLDSKGNPRPELFVEDQLHMNAAGYTIWKDIIGPFLPW